MPPAQGVGPSGRPWDRSPKARLARSDHRHLARARTLVRPLVSQASGQPRFHWRVLPPQVPRRAQTAGSSLWSLTGVQTCGATGSTE